MNDPLYPVPLPPSVSLDSVVKLGATIGQEAATQYLITYAGLTGDALRQAQGLDLDQTEITEEAWREIEAQAPGFGDPLMAELRRVAVIWSATVLARLRQP